MPANHQTYITRNLVSLGEQTKCTDALMGRCVEKGILHLTEKSTILEDTKSTSRGYQFWSILMTRICMEDLIEIFRELKQASVVKILSEATKDGDDETDDNKDDLEKNITPLNVDVVKPTNIISHENDKYKLRFKTTGMALIINVIEYNEPGDRRHGATYDSDYMKALWTQLGYDVTLKRETEFKAEDIRRIVQEFVKEAVEYPHMQSFVVFIGCHGKDGSLYMSDKSRIDLYKDVVFKFDIPQFEGKPKLFFIQACQYFPESGNSVTKHVSDRLTSMEDTVICLSALPGREANRDIFLGSVYVYTLAEVFMREAHQTELQEMLNQVQEKMVTEFKSSNKQIPYHVSYELKPLYFNVRPED